MSPTERRESGRSTRSSTRRSSSRMATRVSRWLPLINISRFKAVTLSPLWEAPGGEPVVIPAIVQLAGHAQLRRHRQGDDSIGEAAERRQRPIHEVKLG